MREKEEEGRRVLEGSGKEVGKEEEKWGRGWGEGGEWNRKVVREWKDEMICEVIDWDVDCWIFVWD